jgi:hypothetical protein
MFRRATFAMLVSLLTAAAAQKKPSTPATRSQASPPVVDSSGSSRLAVKRVVLYKNGIGYFEHTARVRGIQDLAIDFTTGQLNEISNRG